MNTRRNRKTEQKKLIIMIVSIVFLLILELSSVSFNKALSEQITQPTPLPTSGQTSQQSQDININKLIEIINLSSPSNKSKSVQKIIKDFEDKYFEYKINNLNLNKFDVKSQFIDSTLNQAINRLNNRLKSIIIKSTQSTPNSNSQVNNKRPNQQTQRNEIFIDDVDPDTKKELNENFALLKNLITKLDDELKKYPSTPDVFNQLFNYFLLPIIVVVIVLLLVFTNRIPEIINSCLPDYQALKDKLYQALENKLKEELGKFKEELENKLKEELGKFKEELENKLKEELENKLKEELGKFKEELGKFKEEHTEKLDNLKEELHKLKEELDKLKKTAIQTQTPPPSIDPSQEEYLEIIDAYNNNEHVDKIEIIAYASLTKEGATNMQENSEEPFLETTTDKNSKYLVFTPKKASNSNYLLLPRFRVMPDITYQTASRFFTCNGYNSGTQKFTLKQPAKVEPTDGSNQKWKLLEKGELDFTTNL
ncbi:MAG: hypothetical protein KA716_09540 [Gloeotrichia echinulata DEX184]|nr:hypothetical protein [Gloeotrichia echinulata DEX184]